MDNFLNCNQGKRRTRSSLSSTESSESPDLKKPKNTEGRAENQNPREDDEVLVALNMVEELSEKMDDILKKLSKLDSIEQAMNKIQNSIFTLEERTTNLEKSQASTNGELNDIKSTMTFYDEKIIDFQKELEDTKAKNKDLSNQVKDLESKMEGLKTKDLYLEAYSRRENIKFMNIDEKEDENVEEVIRTFLHEHLNFKEHDQVEIQRVHRNPARKDPKRDKPRPILVRFLRSKDCEKIMSLGRNLRHTKYQMFVDLPQDLIKRRQTQMSTFKEAKANKIPVAFSKAEPDKLYIRGQFWPPGKPLDL